MMDIQEGNKMGYVQIMLKKDGKTYLIEKINNKTIKLKDVEELIKPEDVKYITVCRPEDLQELAEFFKTIEEEA
jgi:SepF-like predicted cell division protein (DUF552 family)